MSSVVTLVDGLTEQEEIVRVGHKEHSANTAVTIRVPNIFLGVNLNVVFREHHLDWFEQAQLSTVDKSHTLRDSVLSSTTGSSNDSVNQRLEEKCGYRQVRRTSIEDSVRGTINSEGRVS